MTYINKFQLLSLIALTFTSKIVFSMEYPPANVNVVSAKVMALSPAVWVSGTVVSPNDSKIAVEVSGRLISLADVGTRVKQGDEIARIDDKQLKIQQREDQAKVENSKANLRFLEAEVTRKTQLVKQKLSATTELEKTISERDIAIGNVTIAQAQLDKTKQALSYTRLIAPFSGIIAQQIASVGEFVNNGNAIVRFVETNNSEASVFAPIVTYPFLKDAKKLVVKSPLGEGNALVKSVVPIADARSHLMEVRLDMSSFDWPIGLNIKTEIPSGTNDSSVVVPRDALVLRRNETSVYRVNKTDTGAQAEKISVIVGVGMDGLVAITSATAEKTIQSGDLIIIRGAERLQDGQRVAIKENNNALVLGGRDADDDKPSSQGQPR